MQTLKVLNLAFRFLLELSALGGLAYFGFTFHKPLPVSIIAGIGLPLVAVSLWGVYVAPKSTRQLKQPKRLLVELVVFGFSIIAIYFTGRELLAIIFMITLIVNEIFVLIWKQ